MSEYVDRSIANFYARNLVKRHSLIGNHPDSQFALIDFKGRSPDKDVHEMRESDQNQPERAKNYRPAASIQITVAL